MLAKRIIPCLDIKAGRTVKGVKFEDLRDAGDPVELAIRYVKEGADELVFLDITASLEKRATLLELVGRIAANISIPFTVGGGVSSVKNAAELLDAGADKITINTSAINRPETISELALQFGSQCVVLAIDVRREEKGWRAYSHGGRTPTGLNAISWAKSVVELGAGEILLTSMDHDGTKSGFAIELTKEISSQVSIPVIASGGGGTIDHFESIFNEGLADAALAASIFHFQELEIPKLKNALSASGIPMRLKNTREEST